MSQTFSLGFGGLYFCYLAVSIAISPDSWQHTALLVLSSVSFSPPKRSHTEARWSPEGTLWSLCNWTPNKTEDVHWTYTNGSDVNSWRNDLFLHVSSAYWRGKTECMLLDLNCVRWNYIVGKIVLKRRCCCIFGLSMTVYVAKIVACGSECSVSGYPFSGFREWKRAQINK